MIFLTTSLILPPNPTKSSVLLLAFRRESVTGRIWQIIYGTNMPVGLYAHVRIFYRKKILRMSFCQVRRRSIKSSINYFVIGIAYIISQNDLKCISKRDFYHGRSWIYSIKMNWKDSNKKILLTSGQRVSVMLALHSKHFYVKYNWT